MSRNAFFVKFFALVFRTLFQQNILLFYACRSTMFVLPVGAFFERPRANASEQVRRSPLRDSKNFYLINGGSKPPPYEKATPFTFHRLPLVLALRRAMYEKLLCFSPFPLCRAAKEQFPKAVAFGVLSWFVLCHEAKNEHKRHPRGAKLYARPATQLQKV